jgi:FtsZ-interacting cell division protein ZipA
LSNDFNSSSRSGYRAKRKKTNLVLNSLIIIILLLIIFVAYTIFSSGSDKSAPKKDHPITKTVKKSQSKNKDSKDTAKSEQSSDNTSGDNQSSDQTTDQNNGDNQQSDEASTPPESDQTQAVVTNGGSSSNVQKTIENPAWKPVGTSQTGAHTPTYDTESVDWQEMLNAISYATGLDQSNMIVNFLGRDKSTTNASIGTVSSKDKQQKYKVYIKWVDGQGWQPTKVEELSAIQ